MLRRVKSLIGLGLDLARRAYNKPPHLIALWLYRKVSARRAANRLPRLARTLTPQKAAARLDCADPDDVFRRALATPPFPVFAHDRDRVVDALADAAVAEIRARAERAMRREVDMLGSGPVRLGTPIDWHADFKSGVSWPLERIGVPELMDLERPSDIKIPWELSRLQWLLPVGQAYCIEPDERYAAFAREIVEEWIAANPICRGPNWICAMDVAMRAMSICWLFLALAKSDAWSDSDFRGRLLVQLFLHGEFVIDNLEWSDVAGNHLTTDLAGLVVIGLMLGGRGRAREWADKGWRMLEEQFPMQVPGDGVCREASAPYHRLVAELFLLPALARRCHGLPVAADYWDRLANMAPFIIAATRPDGEIPIWGDADDGRALPLGTQALNDHRYLIETLRALDAPPARPVHDETLWWLGPGRAPAPEIAAPASAGFGDCGVYVMRAGDDHVFIDAGPVGMAGRGGHGHNDCLAFEATLRGTRLVVDPGCYVYTADWRARNRFRGTAAHNTPEIDGHEINRIARWDWLWYLENDALPEVRLWQPGTDRDLLIAAHAGYRRLSPPATPVRTLMLDKDRHRLIVRDSFAGTGPHRVRVPLTFAPGVGVETVAPGHWRLGAGDAAFSLVQAAPEDWSAAEVDAEYSPSYGVKVPTRGLVFSRSGPLRPLAFALLPADDAGSASTDWLASAVDGLPPAGD